MRILLTGANGMLGLDLERVLVASGHQVVGTDIDTVDVRRPAVVRDAVRSEQVDMICHLAALTDVDACEQDPDSAYLTNTVGTENVSLACRSAGIPIAYVSTLSVFDGVKPVAYNEFDQPNPLSHYSRSKYAGELVVRTLVPEHYIVRAGWLFGGGRHDKKFVARILALAHERTNVSVVDDKFGSPTYTVDISRTIEFLIGTAQFGLYHAVNQGEPVSRYDIACEIIRAARIKSCEVKPVNSAAFPLSAPRPRMEAGTNYHLQLCGYPPMRPWRDALREYVGHCVAEHGR